MYSIITEFYSRHSGRFRRRKAMKMQNGGLLALLAAALLLSGCAGAQKAPAAAPVPTAAPTAEPTTAPTAEPTAVPTAAPAPTEAPTPTPEPPSEPTPAPTETPEPGPTATPVAPGTYVWNGPEGKWTVQLRADGLFTLTDPSGAPHTGEGWTTEPDGTVLCGPTDIYYESFAFDGGCSRWTVQGQSCAPAERP